MNDVARVARELAHWQKWQSRVDDIWGWETPAGMVRAARRANLFLELGRMNPDSIVLEIGCGTGAFSDRIAPFVKKLWATDLSPQLLERAKRRLANTGYNAKVIFELQDATELQLPPASFDAIFGCSVLHHLDLIAALSEAHRMLRPGGWCVFSEPNMLNPQIALQKNVPFLKRKLGDSPDETAFFRRQLIAVLRQTGFGQIEVRNFDFLHPLTPAFWVKRMQTIGDLFERCPGLRAISGSLILCAQKTSRD